MGETSTRRAQWIEAKRRERAQREASKRDGSHDAYVSLCYMHVGLMQLELTWP